MAIRSAACWCPIASPFSTHKLGTTRQRDAATTAQSLPSTCRATACACSAPTACARSVLVLSRALSSYLKGASFALPRLCIFVCECVFLCTLMHLCIYIHASVYLCVCRWCGDVLGCVAYEVLYYAAHLLILCRVERRVAHEVLACGTHLLQCLAHCHAVCFGVWPIRCFLV